MRRRESGAGGALSPRAAHSLPTFCGLSLNRHETDGVLKRHGVTEDLLSVEEFRREADSLRGAN